MARRNLLHVDKLEDFKDWLNREMIEHRPGKGTWEVLQVKTDDGIWPKIYDRGTGERKLTHYTVQDKLVPLVQQFIEDQHADRKSAIKITVYFHAPPDQLYEKAAAAGLTSDAADFFRHFEEIVIIATVDQHGKVLDYELKK